VLCAIFTVVTIYTDSRQATSNVLMVVNIALYEDVATFSSMLWLLISRMKTCVVSRRRLYQFPSVLTTPTRAVVEGGVAVAAALVLAVVQTPVTDHREASPAASSTMYPTSTTSLTFQA